MVRSAVPADLQAIIALWAERAQVGAADAPDEGDITRRLFAQLPVMPVGVSEVNGRIAGVATCTRFVAATGENIVRVDPLLAVDPIVERELYAWTISGPEIGGGAYTVDAWLVCSAPGLMPEFGFEEIRRYLRLDRASLDDLSDAVLPSDIAIIGPDDPRANMVAWAQLYNTALAGEWRFAPILDFHVRGFVLGPGRHSITAIDAAGNPVALALARLETRQHDHLPQPMANVVILCTSPDRMRSRIGEGILRAVLIRLREAGARSATIRADEGSKYRSYVLYERVGFQRSLEICIWSRQP